ncbi:archaeosortase/exosortase family protein [Geodermatophilus marinus]|uniref:archaeosortase/exosortase family protein n=1 Tax=Geodermatophilus sp. LHW52908 TaxID=2303986 RepID=UPI0013143E65|nr:archaeosortase/exosortase family protein [Geodermatophilus sp. LHW52908]
MTAATTSGATLPARSGRSPGSTRRLLPVLADLGLAAAICVLGFRYLAGPLQTVEARGVVAVLRLAGIGEVSGVLPQHVLVFRDSPPYIIDAVVTASCSSVLSVLGLTALTAVVLRSRALHALGGLVVAVGLVLLLNHLRLLLSTLAGLWWGDGALVLFHDWVGTVWNLAATLGGFLVLVYVALPAPERAEQDAAGRHTARRPDGWARPGLGYRVDETGDGAGGGRRRLAGLLHRFLLPRGVSRRLAARREAARIDYRIGHLPADLRAARVRELAADGLGVHTASLVAVATYEEDPAVLDALAEAVAARQWEPVTGHRIAALRLWARGWLLARSARGPGPVVPAEPVTGALRTLPAPRLAVPGGPPAPPPAGDGTPAVGRHRARGDRPASFARPVQPGPTHPQDAP